jgi:hypothetical protein
MAEQLPLNDFKLFNKTLIQDQDVEIYEVPETVTGVVLACQITNTSNQLQTVDVFVKRGPLSAQVVSGDLDEGDEFPLIIEGQIPAKDVFNPLVGRLILEQTDRFFIRGSSNDIKINFSVLETDTSDPVED